MAWAASISVAARAQPSTSSRCSRGDSSIQSLCAVRTANPAAAKVGLGDRRRVGPERRAEALVVPLVPQHQAADQLVVGVRRRALHPSVEGERQQHDAAGGPAGAGKRLDPRRRHEIEEGRRRHQVVAGHHRRIDLRQIGAPRRDRVVVAERAVAEASPGLVEQRLVVVDDRPRHRHGKPAGEIADVGAGAARQVDRPGVAAQRQPIAG